MIQKFALNLLSLVLVGIICVSLSGCNTTESAQIEDVGRSQRVTVSNPTDRGVEIPVTITISGEINGDAYLYLGGIRGEIRPRVPGEVMDIFGHGRTRHVFQQQVGSKQNLTFVYVPVGTTKGRLSIDVKFGMSWF